MIENVKTKDGDIVVLYKVGSKQSMYFDLILFSEFFHWPDLKKDCRNSGSHCYWSYIFGEKNPSLHEEYIYLNSFSSQEEYDQLLVLLGRQPEVNLQPEKLSAVNFGS